MKKYTAYKTLQLLLFIALAALILSSIFASSDFFHRVANDPAVKLLAIINWITLGLSFLFILIDFTFFFNYRKEYREMEYAAHSDPVSGIANRFSCDMMVEKYLDKPLPANMTVIMFDISNIQEINRLYGHVSGNDQIRAFSNILRLCSEELCFVGRNGGNKFMAIFEDGSKENTQKFLELVEQRVGMHNRASKSTEIRYKYGTACSNDEQAQDITGLISLANSRIQ